MLVVVKNAPATFHRERNLKLASMRWQFALVYLDDIVVFSKSLEVHTGQVRRVLRLLYKSRATLQSWKYKFFAGTTDL